MSQLPIARLVPPYGDKHWSFQVLNVEDSDVRELLWRFQDPRVKAANPFLQGNSRGWAMVEFWTKDKALVDNAAAVLFDLFKLPVFEGQFTREDLGLA